MDLGDTTPPRPVMWALADKDNMAQIRSDVHKVVSENDFNAVVFQDPFQDEARKAKRNVVAASFGALLISTLDLQINGFLGLQTATGTILAASITKGLACIIVIYFLAASLFPLTLTMQHGSSSENAC